MSIVSNSPNKNRSNKSDKRGLAVYLDLFIAILDTIIIIFVFVLINNSIFLLSLIGLVLLAILITGTVITFLKRNPYYIIFCYGLLLCGILGNVFSTIGNIYFVILFIPYAFYVYSIIEYTVLVEKPFFKQFFVEGTPDSYTFVKKSQKQERVDNTIREKLDNIDKRFKFNLISLISIGCSIVLFIILISSAVI